MHETDRSVWDKIPLWESLACQSLRLEDVGKHAQGKPHRKLGFWMQNVGNGGAWHMAKRTEGREGTERRTVMA